MQSRKNGVSKNEEIQALDYRFTEESETRSNWDSQSIAPTEEKGTIKKGKTIMFLLK